MGGEWSASTYLTGGPVSAWDQEGRGWMGILSCKVFYKSPYVSGWISCLCLGFTVFKKYRQVCPS